MKILHTSDWHLGHTLKGRERSDEHSLYFEWLLEVLKSRKIDILLISGDIFDRNNPPNYALKLYYNFLAKSSKVINLKKIVIISGNHDLSHTLNASKNILDALNISIITDEDSLEEQIIKIKDNSNNLISIVCAVPFLKEKILKKMIKGIESDSKDRELLIKEGIKNHYNEILNRAKEISNSVPIIAMGHLTINGAEISNSERDLYIGNLKGVDSKILGDFDYIALGHFHKFQKIDENIYYSGSPIPLNFSEYDQNNLKKVIILNFNKNKKVEKEFIDIPIFRKLITIESSLDEIEEQLEIEDAILKSWIDVKIDSDFKGNYINDQINEIALKNNLDILFVESLKEVEEDFLTYLSPNELTPIEVFMLKLEEKSIDEDKKEILTKMFNEILFEIEN